MISSVSRNKRPRIFYGWFIVAICFINLSVGYALWNGFPLLYPKILNEFGWSRADTATIFSVGAITYGFASVIGGALLDRLGPRKLFSFFPLFIVVGGIGFSLAIEMWHFYLLYGVVLAFGIAVLGYVPGTALASRWFIKRRATAIGITQAGTHEAMILAPLIMFGILNIGWRYTALAIAVIAGILMVSLAQFLRARPEDKGLLPDGEAMTEEEKKAGQSEADSCIVDKKWVPTDWTLLRVMKQYRAWALFSLTLLMGINFNIMLTHQVVFMIDIGFTEMFAASVVLLFAILTIVGRFSAFISDIIGREATFAISCSGIILGVLMLVFIRDTSAAWMLYVYAICFGFCNGVSSPVYAAAAADLFQGRHFGTILGVLNMGYGLGTAIGAWVGGYIFDITGNYILAFAVVIITGAMMFVAFWVAAPRKIRLVAGKTPKEN